MAEFQVNMKQSSILIVLLGVFILDIQVSGDPNPEPQGRIRT